MADSPPGRAGQLAYRYGVRVADESFQILT
jgi:hypothetical protein